MTPFREALDLLLSHTPLLPAARCRIGQAAGRVLREEIRADRAFPPFDRVMMDGYALRSADWQAGRRSFHVTGIAPAGQPVVYLADKPSSCIEVMTGAPLPGGADSIVPIEEISRAGGDEILIAGSYQVVAGRFIHRTGSDAVAGTVLLNPATLLGSRQIGVAASCGAEWLEVARLPNITVIATGDELVAVNETPAAYQIRQSNAHAIACTLRRAGYMTCDIATLGDDAQSSAEVLRDQLAACEWLILTGAVSRGARDFIPALLDALGCTRLFHGVAQRPGKPAGCWIGPAGQVIMALPGNPVSALIGLHAFVLPALAVASGLSVPKPRMVIAERGITGLSGMTHHLPVTLCADGSAHAAATGNSGDFIGLLKSDGFITLPPRGDIAAAFPFTPWL
ncbi:MAG: molybdopterin molybdotransferase MoeA [Verrucomicrobia bacterium]|nr:molybdopterin molybdotransferase MoeA [Verrucomicrobiota bacterium]